MASYTVLECCNPGCGKLFRRLTKEAKRGSTLGRPSYCSRSCLRTHKNLLNPCDASHLVGYAYGRPTRFRDEYSSFRYFVNKAKCRSRCSGRGCDITCEYLKELWESQEGICPYTGWALRLEDTSLEYDRRVLLPDSASLDRLDSALGYLVGNVQFVSVMANFAKHAFSHEEMVEFCRAVAAKWG